MSQFALWTRSVVHAVLKVFLKLFCTVFKNSSSFACTAHTVVQMRRNGSSFETNSSSLVRRKLDPVSRTTSRDNSFHFFSHWGTNLLWKSWRDWLAHPRCGFFFSRLSLNISCICIIECNAQVRKRVDQPVQYFHCTAITATKRYYVWGTQMKSGTSDLCGDLELTLAARRPCRKGGHVSKGLATNVCLLWFVSKKRK